MSITTTIIGKKHNAATIKFTATADTDTATVALSTPITIAATGNVTFVAATHTLTRTTGSWSTDLVEVGSVLIITNTVSNNGTFIVKSFTATDVVIENNTSSARNYLVDETAAAAAFTGSYKSVLLAYGQIISGTPKVNIARCRYSVSSAGSVSVSRNSVVTLKLFGHDEIECPTSENNTHPIVTLFSTTAGGTLIMEVTKVEGFSAVNPSQLPY